MNHEVFISYQTESLDFVEQLCKLLENYDIKCWYGNRDVISNHASEIPKAIRGCKVFLLIVDENVATHPRGDILNEVYLASKLFKKGLLDMMSVNITSTEYEDDELLYHLGRLQKKFLIDKMLPDGAINLLAELLTRLGRGECSVSCCNKPGDVRYKNDYFDINDEHERNRLNIQLQILKKFDSDVYERILSGRKNLSVLDIGCNEGNLTMDRFGKRPEVRKIIGIDINSDAIESAKSNFENEKASFYLLNCEDADFGYDLAEIREEHDIDKFDIIHISMLLLHIENPSKLLKRIKPLLSKGGKLFIRDIDDTLTFVHPDPMDGFSRMIRICAREELSGYRHSGKEIYSMLIENGYRNVALEKKGLDTSQMDFEEKDALFHTYFSFIYEDTKTLYIREPDNKRVRDDYNWLENNYEALKQEYYKPETLFQLGFVTYTAEK